MERPLPSWAPLAIAVFGLVLIPVLFAIPRESEGVDTFLEAVPFFVMFLGVVSFVVSRPGKARVPGAVFALVVLLAPLWWPLALGAMLSLGQEPPNVAFTLSIVPEGEGSYTVLVPSPVDGSGDIARVVAEARLPVWDELTMVDGVWYLRVQDDGPVQRTYRLEGDKADEKWPDAVYPQQGPRFDAPTYPVLLESGEGPVRVQMWIVGKEPYCSFDQTYDAEASPDGEGFARLGEHDYVCT